MNFSKIIHGCVILLISVLQVPRPSAPYSSTVQDDTVILCPSQEWNLILIGFGLGVSLGFMLDLLVVLRLQVLVLRQNLVNKALSLKVRLQLPAPRYSRPKV